jgi:cytochrome c-type biogenesis protein CcmH
MPAVARGLMRAAIAAVMAALLSAGPALPARAADTAAAPEDPALTARIKKLESELRCLVCQAQSVADSDSEFSQDVRREVDRLIAEGRSDAEIKDFLVQRYGDFILFKPPVKPTTALLWGGPLILLLIGGGTLAAVLARRRRSASTGLTEQDRRRAEALLAAGNENGKGEG